MIDSQCRSNCTLLDRFLIAIFSQARAAFILVKISMLNSLMSIEHRPTSLFMCDNHHHIVVIVAN